MFIYIGATLESVEAEVTSGSTEKVSLLPPNVLTRDLYSTLRVSCMASGNPTPLIEWFKGNSTTPLSNVVDGVMEISELGLSDRGFYYCTVFNEHEGEMTIERSDTLQLNITGN